MTTPSANFVRQLAWDSEAFGFAVARIENIEFPEEQIPLAMEQLAESGIALAYWEAPKGDEPSRTAARKAGGDWINSRVTLVRDIVPADAAPPALKVISNLDGLHRSQLDKLAISSGWSSRFAIDPKFPRQIFRKMYRSWMSGSIVGRLADAIIVAEDEREVVGMITVSAHGALGEIGLFSVADRMRGQGIGKRLLGDATSWFARQDCTSAKVVTQGENIAALAIYRHFDFHPTEETDVFHFWRPDT